MKTKPAIPNCSNINNFQYSITKQITIEALKTSSKMFSVNLNQRCPKSCYKIRKVESAYGP